jgi:branched-chain amino acid transport system ATP-binding protein
VTTFEIRGLHAHYGTAHVLHGVDLAVTGRRTCILGRNGMGKTTLCQSIMGLVRDVQGSVRLDGRELLGCKPWTVARAGIGYVPQGRHVFRTLSVEENLRVAQTRGKWDATRVFDLFPRLAERRRNRAADLSGGEQQMLAIGRALVTNPTMLLMDEPSEGLAPVVVDQLVKACLRLSQDEDMMMVVVEQSLPAALAIAQDIVVVGTGRIHHRWRIEDMTDPISELSPHLGVARTRPTAGADPADNDTSTGSPVSEHR